MRLLRGHLSYKNYESVGLERVGNQILCPNCSSLMSMQDSRWSCPNKDCSLIFIQGAKKRDGYFLAWDSILGSGVICLRGGS